MGAAKDLADVKPPSEVLQSCVDIFQKYAKIVGADVLRPDFRPNIITVCVILSITFYLVFTMTTIVSMFEENWKFMLEALVLGSSVLQGITKLATVLNLRKTMMQQIEDLKQLYVDYERRGDEYRAILVRWSGNLRKMLLVMMVAYVFGCIFVILPAYVMPYVGSKKRVLVMHFHIPLVDINTDWGFKTTLVVHSITFIFGCFGVFGGDCIVFIMFFQIFVFADIFKVKKNKLNEIIETAEMARLPRVEHTLNELVDWHQFYMNYNQSCSQIFYYVISSMVGLSGGSITLTIYILLKGEWHGATIYLPILVATLYLYCILGTQIEIANELIMNTIYDIHWYNMTVRHQKTVLLMLLKSHNTAVIDVAGFMPLSVSTALQITKTIYTITMMILQFT